MNNISDLKSAISSLESYIYRGASPIPAHNLLIKLLCGDKFEGNYINTSGDYIIFEIIGDPKKTICIPFASISYISF